MALLLRAELLARFFSYFRDQWVPLGSSFDGPRFDSAGSVRQHHLRNTGEQSGASRRCPTWVRCQKV
jgi:hypothetical protein